MKLASIGRMRRKDTSSDTAVLLEDCECKTV